MIQSSRFYRTYRLHVLITVIALILEYILGMYTNLLVKFPDTLVNGNAWEWSMSHNIIVMAHVLLGTLLLLISLSTLGFAIALKNKAAITTAITGVVMILVAYLSGSVFLGNIDVDGYSFSMSLGFLGALVAYGLAYYLTRPTHQITS